MLPALSRVLAASAAAALLTTSAQAAPLPAHARAVVEAFLTAQAAGAAGQVSVSVADPSSALAPCASLQPFLPPGIAAWGRVSVGLRCAGEHPWTRYLAAQVTVRGPYLVAAHPIEAGAAVSPQDSVQQVGDLTRLPRSVLTDEVQLRQTVAINRIAAGAPLRSDMLRSSPVIRQGQAVRVLSVGQGFVVSTDAKAITNATAGATLQVKTSEGRMLTVVAGSNGQVLVPGSGAPSP